MSEYLPIRDWSFWDSIDKFSFNEVAWLWCGLEPLEHIYKFGPSNDQRDNLPPNPIPPAMAARIRNALLSEFHSPQANIRPIEDNSLIPYYRRSDLRTWAEQSGFKPLFLFPELRPESQTELSLEGALKIIAVLARAVNSRWSPGKPAPHGMVKQLTEVAGSLGLQLDRNKIGKYLKEAGNKNISA